MYSYFKSNEPVHNRYRGEPFLQQMLRVTFDYLRQEAVTLKMSCRLACVIGFVFGLSALAHAQNSSPSNTYPNKPIRFIVPFPAGSAPDAIARIVGQSMQVTLGQPMILITSLAHKVP